MRKTFHVASIVLTTIGFIFITASGSAAETKRPPHQTHGNKSSSGKGSVEMEEKCEYMLDSMAEITHRMNESITRIGRAKYTDYDLLFSGLRIMVVVCGEERAKASIPPNLLNDSLDAAAKRAVQKEKE